MRIPYDNAVRFPIPKFRLPENPPEPTNLETRALPKAMTETKETPSGLKLRPLDEHPLRQIYAYGANTPASSYSRSIAWAGYDPNVVPEPNFPGPRFPKPFGSPDRNNRTEFYHERSVGQVAQNPMMPAEKLPWVVWNPRTEASTRPSEDMAEPFRNPIVDQPMRKLAAFSTNPMHDAVASQPQHPYPSFEANRMAHVKFY